MIPPSKPVVSRVKDDTVVVRWNISNNNGLSILFFKVQFKEIPFANQTYTSNKGTSLQVQVVDGLNNVAV